MLADRAVPRRLDPQRQPEDLDEPDRRRVIERVALVVGGKALSYSDIGERRPTTTADPWSSRTRTSPDTTRCDDATYARRSRDRALNHRPS